MRNFAVVIASISLSALVSVALGQPAANFSTNDVARAYAGPTSPQPCPDPPCVKLVDGKPQQVKCTLGFNLGGTQDRPAPSVGASATSGPPPVGKKLPSFNLLLTFDVNSAALNPQDQANARV